MGKSWVLTLVIKLRLEDSLLYMMRLKKKKLNKLKSIQKIIRIKELGSELKKKFYLFKFILNIYNNFHSM